MTDSGAQIGLPVLRLLADGERRSGQELAAALGVSRAAVWKQVKRLQALGLAVDVRRGAGYRIEPPLDVLDAALIRGALTQETRARLDALEVMTQVPSTNSRLFGGERPAPGRMAVCLAEHQSGGRGRRGRSWLAPPGRGLCLSVAWAYPSPPDGIESLGLVAGAVVRDVLTSHAGIAIGIKWPNDLIVDDRKLGGILIELSAEGHGACFVVVGVGINVTAVPSLARTESDSIPLHPIDLATATTGRLPLRNALASALVDAFGEMFDRFSTTGFGAYRSVVAEADYLRDRIVTVESSAGPMTGRAVGISADGRLRVEFDGEVREIVAGDVSVRPGA